LIGVRLATFNLMHGRSVRDGIVDPERLRAAAAAVDADVIGLQEVDRAQPRSGHADLTAVVAEALGATHSFFVPALVGTPGGTIRTATDADAAGEHPLYGTALVSRWPVVEWRVERLPGAPVRSPIVVPGRVIFLRDEPRVLVAAVVESPIGLMTVASTHLSFVPGWNVRQLRWVIRALRTMPAPRVLLADLNLPGSLASAFSGWRRLARRPTYPSPAPKVQFDHVLLDPRGGDGVPSVIRVTTPDVPISDHRPLVVELSSATVWDRTGG
jgi:endonuclease/exonuclease/phosphatase family metal-dependent hydrolase